jgi:mannitol/fructose-specific phosphotransferase system IIA component (Ntr-type)
MNNNTDSGVHISDFLKERNVICQLTSHTRDEAVSDLLRLLQRNKGGFDFDQTLDLVLNREKTQSTIIHPGVAVPHARLENLKDLELAIGVSKQGVDFLLPEKGLVHIIFLILTPKSLPILYLKVLAALVKILSSLPECRLLADCTRPAEIYDLLTAGSGQLPKFLLARHIMTPPIVKLQEHNQLDEVLDAFFVNHVEDIPVVDEQGDIRGVISLEDILRLTLPEHMLWMEDLTPILYFQPFVDLLHKEREMRLADFMREDFVTVSPDLPAIQLARIFLTERVRQILVLEGRRLMGVVSLSGFVSKVLWT